MATSARTKASERVVFAQTSDGYSQAGVLFEPEGKRAPTLVIWLHGIHLQFCEQEYVAIGRAVASPKAAFLTANTRGHDFGAWMRGENGLKLAGSGWELLHECSADLDGWLKVASAEGYENVVLAGHGFGGSKIIYHLSNRHEAMVRGIILASCASIVRDLLKPEYIEVAKQMVEEGRGTDLLPWGARPGVIPGTVSAQVLVARERLHHDLYGDGSQPPALTRIRVPTLAWFGEKEVRIGQDTQQLLHATAQNLTACPLVDIKLLPEATYLYTGVEHVVAKEILQWVGRVCPSGKAKRTSRP